MFKDSSLTEIQNSIQPVITKVDPKNDQFDIDVLISKSFEILTTHLSNYALEELGMKQYVIAELGATAKEAKTAKMSA